LNTKVLNVKPSGELQLPGGVDDFTRKWTVEVYNYNTKSLEEHIFDGIIVASGY